MSTHKAQRKVIACARLVSSFALLALSFIFVLLASRSAFADESICAQVKIEIKQELTLERQAFDAHMGISNGLDGQALENVNVNVTFKDENGLPVLATSDPNNTTAMFYIRVDTMTGINDIVGNGTVAPATTADIHWLIIPTVGAGGSVPTGKLYFVGATLSYSIGGEPQSITVTPDSIYVKPLPQLTLDYFLTKDVYADDAFTAEIEPAEPFTLGVRAKNSGSAAAKSVKIESAQPKITENKQGLLIGFQILGSYVNDQSVTNSLLVNLGDIAPGRASAGRWTMVTTLSGKFIDFSASFTHADSLGGVLTSLIKEVKTHYLIRDVKIDLPGRDSIRDFLSQEIDTGVIRLYESEGVDTDVAVQSASSTLTAAGTSGGDSIYMLSAPPTAGAMYVQLADPFNGTKTISRVTRADGKVLTSENAWISKTRKADNTWNYFINVFDANTSGSYSVAFATPVAGPRAPALQMIADQVVPEGTQVSFIVQASDPDGTVPTLSAAPLATGARFTDGGNGNGTFDWTPTVGQAGRYPINFTASDGALTTIRTATITVTPLTPGAPDLPVIESPAVGTQVATQKPTLSVAANTNVYDSTGQYQFETYRDAAMTQLVVASPDVPKKANAATTWDVSQNLSDNTDFYWRVRSSNGVTFSAWANGRFKVNTFNDPPTAVQLTLPSLGATVDTLTPTLSLINSKDVDGDAITYDFEVFSDAALSQRVAYVSGVAAGSNGSTSWKIDVPLSNTTLYYWRATAVDSNGARRTASAWNFLVDTNNPAPGAPSIAQPVVGSVVTTTSTDLTVTNSVVTDGQPTTYLFEIDVVNSFDSAAKKSSGFISEQAGSTHFNVANLIENQHYYWRVKASDGISESAWVVGDFSVDTVNDAPPSPALKNPGQNAAVTTTTPRLEITGVTDPEGDAVQYRFEVYADQALSSRVADVLAPNTEWVVSPQLSNSQQYWWRVRAEDARGGIGAWSATQTFIVNVQTNNKPTITLTAPTAIDSASGSYTLAWEIQDPENNSTIALYYDTDNQGQDGKAIVSDLHQDPAKSTGSYNWDLSQLQPGTYYVYATANNGKATDTRYAPGAIVIPVPQPRGVINVSAPSSNQTTEEGGQATFTIVLGNAPTADVVIGVNSTNPAEGSVSPASVTFTQANWNVPQTITVTGVGDCAIDGNVAYQIATGKAVSADPNYNGLNPNDVSLTNIDKGTTCNLPPTVTVAADFGVNENAAANLTGSASDSDGTIASYAWTQVSGPSVTITNANQATATFTAPAVTADTILTFRLTATDNQGAKASADLRVTVRNVNVLPTANAGADQANNEGAVITLIGSGTDSDGTIATYQWAQVSGPTAVLNNANTAQATFIAPQVTADTVLQFSLTVTDNDGGTAVATTNVTVRNVNQIPTANAGAPQTVNENVQVSLTGSGTDNDGTIASYAWTQTAGPVATLVNATSAAATFIAPAVTADSVLTFQLTVTDNQGASGVASTTVTVRNVNQAPTANAGVDQTIGEGSTVNLSGSATDNDGTIASYAWVQTAGPAVTLTNPNSAATSFVAPEVTASTALTFKLTVVDNEGASGSANVTINVVNVNKLPIANAGSAQTVNEGAAVTLSGSGSDIDGTVVSYAWTQTAGPSATLTNANSATASFTAPSVTADTVLTFRLTVTDNEGGSGSATVNIAVKNVNTAPTANAGAAQSVNSGATVTLSGSGSDTDGTITTYAWTQTAGPSVTLNNANTATATFTAPTVSTDTVLSFTLTVTDNDGASANASVSVTVTAAGGPPGIPASITVPATSDTGNYTISWGASTGTVTEYQLYESTGSGFNTYTSVYTGTALSVNLTNRPNNITYYYRVRACYNNPTAGWACSDYRTGANGVAVAIPNTPPGIPASITVPATSDTGNYTISWGASTGTVTQYQLYESTSPAFSGFTSVYTGTGLSVNLANRPNNITYYYRVRACYNDPIAGWACSDYRTGANGVAVAIPNTPPGIPASITIPASSSTGSYTISWGASTGTVTEYQLYESTGSAQYDIVYSGTNLSVTLSNKPNNITYYYRVRACYNNPTAGWACSDYLAGSNGVTVNLVPGIPASITTPATSNTDAFTVSWGASTGTVTEYELWQSQYPDFSNGAGIIYRGTALSATTAGQISNGYTYYYRVRACNGTACSDFRTASNGTVVEIPVPVPSSITVPATSDNGSYAISWGASSGAISKYELIESTDSNFSTFSLVYSASSLNTNLGGKQTGVTYYYAVRACNTSPSRTSCSDYLRGTNGVVVSIPPGAPATLTVPTTSDTGNYTISWGAASSGVATSYELYESADRNFNQAPVTLIYSGAGLSFDITNRPSGDYYYRVRACNTSTSGTLCSNYATSSTGGVAVNVIPGIPASITVPATNETGSFTVTWGTASGPVNVYELYEATDSAFSGAVSRVYAGPDLTTTLSGKANGVTYYYRVRACNVIPNREGCSDYRTATNGVAVNMTPSVPTSIAVPARVDTNSYTIAWGAASGPVTKYELHEATDAGFSTPTQIYGGTNLSVDVPAKVDGVTYYYRVRACNAAYCSDYLNAANGATMSFAPGSPSSIIVPANSNTGNYTISWAPVTMGTVTRYELQEATDSAFTLGVVTFTSTTPSFDMSGKTTGVTYYYRVHACNDMQSGRYCSAYRTADNGIIVNAAPTANAGAAQTVNEGAAVTLVGSGTDTDGTIASYAWTQTAGPAVTLANANSATATFTAPSVTTSTVLTFALTVTDNLGATGTASTSVTVNNVNQLPAVNAGANQTIDENTAVTLSGTASDSDGTIATYLWTQTAGPSVILTNANTATATFTAPEVTADTALSFSLTATDNEGGSTSVVTNVTVRNVNKPPVANAGTAQSVNEGAAVTLTGTATDADGTIASYVWTQAAGPAVTLTNANSATATFTAPQVTADTVLSFTLTVTDNAGASGTGTTNVTVRNINQLPTANAGAVQTVNEGAAVTLTGSGTDTDGTIAAYAWTQTSGPAVTLTNANTATASFVAPQVTADTVLGFSLMVTDNNGGTGTATTSVTVRNVNQLPTANAGSAQTVNEGANVTLSGSGTDPDGTIASYAWTQTAGTAVTLTNANTATATFAAPQVAADSVLTFQLKVTDNNGGTGTATVNVTVKNVSVTGKDLIVLSVSPSLSQISLGQSFTVSDTIKNQGVTAITTSFSVRYYLSTDATITTTDTVLGTRTVASLAAGATNSATTTVTFPTTLAPGTYYIGAIVDYANTQAESNETNNALSGGAVTAVRSIDLVMTAASTTTTTVQRGKTLTISNTVKNQGVSPTGGAFAVGLYLSADTTITTGDVALTTRSVTSLAAGATSSASTSVTIPSTLAPGTYYIGAIADSANAQAETNETNNALAGTKITVQ